MDVSQEIGLVDLETLIKIYEQLVQSHYEDDNDLARFIREKYLPEDFNDSTTGGVQIQGKESFTKLYNAYKRVRNLTGRVQDKWPFFDRRWKTINKNVVIKIAAGEDNATRPDALDGNSLKSSSESSGAGKSQPTNIAQHAQSTSQDLPSASHVAADGQIGESTLNEVGFGQEPHAAKDQGKLSPSPPALVVPSSITPPRSSKSVILENDPKNDMSSSLSPGSVLAAEAPSERSNLDNLPGSSKQKRKFSPDSDHSERTAGGNRGMNKRQRGATKAARARGGKKKSSRLDHTGFSDDEIDHTPSTFDTLELHHDVNPQSATTQLKKHTPTQKLRATPPSPRITRQKKRISQGSETHSPAHQDSLAGTTSHKMGTRKPRASTDNRAMVENPTSATRNEAASTPGNESTVSDLSEATLLSIGLAHFDSQPEPSTSKSVKVDSNGDNAKSTAPAQTLEVNLKAAKKDAGTVEIFARVSTQTGVHDILLPSSVVEDKGLEKTLLGYAAWKEKLGDKKAVDFETWRSINGFDW